MSRARAARRPQLGEQVSTAKRTFARVGPQKVRSVVDLIRGLTVDEATQQLAQLHRPSAIGLVSRTLKSAVANAKEKETGADPGSLIVGEICVDGGPMLKRMQPRAMGRGFTIRKRTSHLTIRLYMQG